MSCRPGNNDATAARTVTTSSLPGRVTAVTEGESTSPPAMEDSSARPTEMPAAGVPLKVRAAEPPLDAAACTA